MLKEKQTSFDAHEHHAKTILADEAKFDIKDFTERKDLKCVTHLYGQRSQIEKEAKIASELARATRRKQRRHGLELLKAKKAAAATQKTDEKQ